LKNDVAARKKEGGETSEGGNGLKGRGTKKDARECVARYGGHADQEHGGEG